MSVCMRPLRKAYKGGVADTSRQTGFYKHKARRGVVETENCFYAVKTYVRVREGCARSMRVRAWAGSVREKI